MMCRRPDPESKCGEQIQMEVARRFCLEHANEYDVERFREQKPASVFSIATGMKIG